MFDDGAVVELEPARARNANAGRAACSRFVRLFTRRLARANTPANVGNGHARAMNFPRSLETCNAEHRGEDRGSRNRLRGWSVYLGYLRSMEAATQVASASSAGAG
jgi:hypothetical protein